MSYLSDNPYRYQPTGSRWVGIGVVVVLHVLLIWALVTVLARRQMDLIPPPIQTKILKDQQQDVKQPPPPPPNLAKPPPVFVPPPQVNVQVDVPVTTGAISQTTHVAPVMRGISIDKNHPNPKPPFPPEAARLNQQGVTVLKILVDVDGTVIDAQLAKSSGYDKLDQAAIDAVKGKYRFLPALGADGKPMQQWTTLPIRWENPNRL